MRIHLDLHRETYVRNTLENSFLQSAEGRGHQVTLNSSLSKVNQNVDLVITDLEPRRTDSLRRMYPNAIVGSADPKLAGKSDSKALAKVDFTLVSSNEQKHAVMPFNKHAFVYNWFPDLLPRPIQSRQQLPLRIGYHGNRVHIESLKREILPALQDLSRWIPVELVLVYNVKALGSSGISDSRFLAVEEVQWAEPQVWEIMAGCDIGIVPNLIHLPRVRIPDSLSRWASLLGLNSQNANSKDHLLRYKFSSNANRIFPFMMLGVPVVADLFPSAAEFVQHGRTGYLATGRESWLEALSLLAQNPDHRTEVAIRAQEWAQHSYTSTVVYQRFASSFDNVFGTALRGED